MRALPTIDKSLVDTLTSNMTTMKYDGSCNMHEHVSEISILIVKLNALGMNVNECFLVLFIRNSLPPEQ